ncbi:sulfatase family protein [Cellulomonas sp. Y8]|uniref:sulfatase family protein n=1 Tax=Cellulomonas sp. Y8 TaxID=2591145 RepID=UPI003D72DED2
MTPPPNVVWISTHDINPHLGTYSGVWPGAEYADTPNLDRLAAEGARWDNALANAPVCAPSRSAIMTGCYPTAIGTMHMRTKAVPPPEVRLLPEYFREAGYWVSSTPFTDFQVHTPAVTFDECSPDAHWRNRPDPAQPFFAMFHGMITHESQIYLDDEDFEQATSRLTPSQRHDPEKAPLPPYYPDTPVFRRAWARYNDLISAMDHWVGDLLRQLDEDGLAENTIVVFWSDHGLGMPRAKRWASEAGLREPLIVRWPGRMAPGQERTELVQLLDLAPTMLETCGLPVPEHMHGRPFLDARGAALDPNEYVFAGRDRMDEQEDTVRTVRDGRFRYVRNLHPDRPGMGHHEYADRLATWAELRRLSFAEANQRATGDAPSLLTPLQRSILAASRPAEELYDVLHDPHETVDLAPDPAHAATLARLRGALDEWTARHGDLGLVPEDELLARWQPEGVRPTTPAPQITRGRADLSVTCSEPGARIGWTTDPPVTDHTPDPLADAIGSPPADDRRWHLTTGPVPAPTSGPIWVRAWRLGHEPSPEIRVDPA